jgi:hypothetical protein
MMLVKWTLAVLPIVNRGLDHLTGRSALNQQAQHL